MGCDIHAHIEVRIDDKWWHYGIPNVDRHYELFGRIAGVRTNIHEPISVGRGIPHNATFLTLFDYECWEDDAHTPGWLTSEEAQLLEKEFGGIWGYIFGYTINYFHDRRHTDTRIIFWFDN